MSGHQIPRYLVSIEVYDNETKQTLYDDGFNCSHLRLAEAALDRALRKVGRIAHAREDMGQS